MLVAIALLGGLILLITGDGYDKDTGTRPAADVSELQNHFLDRTVVNRDDGISLRRPASWKVIKRAGVTNIASKDGCLVVQLSAPVPAGRAEALRHDGIAVLRSQFKNAKVRPSARAKIGGIPTRSDTISFTDPKGNPIRVLLAVGTGRRNAYLTEVVVRNPACQGDLALAQLMLRSAVFSK